MPRNKNLWILISTFIFLTITSFAGAANIDLDSHKNAKDFSTALQAGYKEPANYNKNYIIIQIGCGSSCQTNWIVNKNSGKIVDTISSSEGLKFDLDNSLIITPQYQSRKNNYYAVIEDKLYLIREDR